MSGLLAAQILSINNQEIANQLENKRLETKKVLLEK